MSLKAGRPRRGNEKEAGFAKALALAKLAICSHFGIPRKETAILLGQRPATMDLWYSRCRETLDELAGFIREVDPGVVAEVVIEKKDYTAEAEKRLGRCLGVLDRALLENDIRVAMQAVAEIHKITGLSQKQTIEHSGSVNLKLVPPPVLDTIQRGAERRGELPASTD